MMLKDKKLCYLLIMVLCIVFVSGCKKNDLLGRHSAQFLQLFDTATEIIIYADSKETFTEQVNFIHDELEVYHKLYDIYNDYDGINNIKTINDNAGVNPVKVDKKIIDLLLFGKELYQKTDKKVNLAFGSVLKIWHDYRTAGVDDPFNAKIPPMEELLEASQFIDYDKVIIDEEQSTVFLQDAKISLDVGAIAKGYAVEQVCNAAEAYGVNHALVSVGGNVKSIGGKPGGGDWNVGMQNPDSTSSEPFIAHVRLNNLALVTSGDYQRYYTVDGKKYHHIIDPDTLMPANHFTAVSILCKDSGLADGLSTALFNMNYEDGIRLIDSMPGVEAAWIAFDGTVSYSSGFEQYIITK